MIVAVRPPVALLTEEDAREILSRPLRALCSDHGPTRVEAEGCARNYRFWDSADIQQLTSGTPNKRGGTSGTAHIWIHGSNTAPPTIRIRKLIVRSTNTTNIFTIEAGAATVILDSCDVKVPTGTRFKVGGSKGIVMKLGNGC